MPVRQLVGVPVRRLVGVPVRQLVGVPEHQWIEKMKNIAERNIFGFVSSRSGLSIYSAEIYATSSDVSGIITIFNFKLFLLRFMSLIYELQ